MNKTLFRREYRIFGLRRSGIHAVSEWIQNLDGSVPCVTENDTKLRMFKGKNVNRVADPDREQDYMNITEHLPVNGIQIKLTCSDSEFLSDRQRVLSETGCDRISDKVYNVIIIRSPENNLASIFKMLRRHGGKANIPWGKHFRRFPDEWTDYRYKLYSYLKELPEQNTVMVFFDKWNSSPDERLRIIRELGFKGETDVEPPSHVSHIGSSFDGYDYSNVKCGVNERWKEFRNDSEFREKLRQMNIDLRE